MLIVGALALGCQVTVADNLTTQDADAALSRLEQAGIAASRGTDADHAGRFAIEVNADDAAQSIAALAHQVLPSERPKGVLEALDDDSLIPSRASEHQRWLVGMAGDISQTLQTLRGVTAAEVHLAVPRKSPLGAEPSERPRASVLIHHEGPELSVDVEQVRRLVAGAIMDMRPEDVTVVTQSVPPHPATDPVVRLGPLRVAASSVPMARTALLVAAGTQLLLLGIVVGLWLRLRRHRRATRSPGTVLPMTSQPETGGGI